MPVPCEEIVNDIEDLVETFEVGEKQRYSSSKKHVKLRARNRCRTETIHSDGERSENQSSIPGTQIIYIKTWGCAHNSSDSEYMAGQLVAYGYRLTEKAEEADLWLLNSCTVKGPAEDHFRNEIEKGRRLGKHIVTAGCVPQGAPRSSYLTGLSVIGTHNIDRVVEVVEETLKGHSVRLFGQKKAAGRKLGGAALELPKVRKNELVEIIAISTGCLNQCTYCKTKHARGDLGSYPPSEIVARAKQAFAEGVREIWLTSEDTGAYGRDIGESLPQLLRALVKCIPAGCMLRLGMTNPPYILEHLQAMAEILNHPRVYKFLHVPVQSGSDSVLADMKREYNVAEFTRVVTFLRERVPGITIATDIICAFPTETSDDFEQTFQLCKQMKFPSLFINQFYPRPGTPAARLPRVPPQEAKRRTRLLTQLFQSYETYGDQKGREIDVLVTEKSTDGANWIGHNEFYHQVVIPVRELEDLMGRMVRVKVTETKKHCLLAVAVANHSSSSKQLELILPSTALLFLLMIVGLLLRLFT